MSKPVILTGLRANNDLHIGNYLGGLLPLVDMATHKADEYQVNIFVPDLHSFTTPIDHSQLQNQIMNNLRLYAAAGLPLDHPDVHIYRQSYVPAHSELTWILDCFTGMGELSRMTQFKDKSTQLSEDRISVGLFNYPVLMACDILLYGACYVPVGDDQSQHIEFTRDIAERINMRFGASLFELPKSVAEQHKFFGKDQGVRIKDLSDPTKKMSKSDESGKGVIFLGDSPEMARKKIMSATTDSLGRINHDYTVQPGISNLLDILALFTGQTIQAVCQKFVGQEQYGPLKTAVADALVVFLQDFQHKLDQVDDAQLVAKLETSEAAMREQANKTLLRVQRAVGLRPKRASGDKKRASGVAKPATVDFGDFAKLDIRMGTILQAHAVEGSDKLIKLTIDLGNEQRTVVTGMREFYTPAEFVGKQLPIIANLKSQTLRGIESHGMLMAIEGQTGPVLLLPEHSVPAGSPLE